MRKSGEKSEEKREKNVNIKNIFYDVVRKRSGSSNKTRVCICILISTHTYRDFILKRSHLNDAFVVLQHSKHHISSIHICFFLMKTASICFTVFIFANLCQRLKLHMTLISQNLKVIAYTYVLIVRSMQQKIYYIFT